MKKIKEIMLFLACSMLVLSGCKTKKGETDPQTQIEITVAGVSQPAGATVYVFDTKSSYESLLATPSAFQTGYITSGTVQSNGKVSFSLAPGKEYWFYATYRSSTSNGEQSEYSNYATAIRSLIQLEKGHSYQAVLQLAQSKSYLSFRTGLDNLAALDITVVVEGDTLLVSDTSTFTLNKNVGQYFYNAHTALGCVWTGNITVGPEDSVSVSLSKCVTGKIVVRTAADNRDLLPIRIKLKLDQADVATGDLTAVSDSVQKPLAPGHYIYHAFSLDNKYTWMGELDIKADSSSKIVLEAK